jgi:F-type H+-transporting ATPase subunit gamma
MENAMVQTLDVLQRKIASAEDLQSVVKTMKALAAVNIRQYERAVEALAVYNRTIELGLHIVLTARQDRPGPSQTGAAARLGALVFGSDQGMCGQLNEHIVGYALENLDDMGSTPDERTVAVVGMRAAARMEQAGQTIERCFTVPTSLAGITPVVQDMLLHLEAWHTHQHIERIVLFYNRHLSGAAFRPHTVHLLPVNWVWLTTLELEAWPTRVLPTFTMEWERLFAALIRQYLFVSLYRACAESLASENASRLAAMQTAEKNIGDRLTELQAQFRRQRQTVITEELLDIVAGFEALTPQDPRENGG